ncbi:type I-E CRISPR-associated protein Cas6/Cse3/CasE (plasmid) [Azospirillum argentinense]|uniref:Type I-E CRISPR-associated protein Cas6/Cse3/CasE n=1 Tax=Azospirillum argentinense TaxID=2970906 RepID=A0A4D8PT63_9PROT|nr:type I-E CRISPR-associated protein Cas6/Cse3/CasE [Azospirillum argentinense]QCO00521.1 type I-E CRISPR-associated protein Cas6/Cse3/CasE [Azospirillum argentinense]
MTSILFSKVELQPTADGSSGALVAYLARTAQSLGHTHHLVWSLFGDRGGDRNFLYRMTGAGVRQPILLYSAEPPKDTTGLWKVESKSMTLPDAVGERVAWSIRVNPVVSRDGKKHDVVTDARRSAPEDERWEDTARRVVPTWLAPRLAKIGLEAPPEAMVLEGSAKHEFPHDRGGRPVTVRTVDVSGTATVTDPAALAAGILSGIGSAKVYGCGMLLLRRLL